MMRGLFVTAIGTGIGKTLVTAILCRQLTLAGRKVRNQAGRLRLHTR